MSERSGSSTSGKRAHDTAAGTGAEPLCRAPLPCFKLRFALQREPGRSYVSAVKPLRLPDVVTVSRERGDAQSGAEEAALERVRAAFGCGPRERLREPQLSSHEYGWWCATGTDAGERDARLRHHIRDSWWLRERLRVLVHDNELRHR